MTSPFPPEDRVFMKRALTLASLGLGRTAPNPTVGCVVVRDGRIIGEGYHVRAGELHAEAIALARAGEMARGSTLYVTLEPCSHWGRTPPCADAVISSGVRRVVAATTDPDPRNQGRGFERLRRAGLEVRVGVRQTEARRLIEGFSKVQQTGLPFVLLKMAMSLDGKIAAHTGSSRWITGAKARSRVQELRDTFDAVLVGVGTVLRDDPALTVRSNELPQPYPRSPRNPVRVLLDSAARTPPAAKVLRSPGQTILLATDRAPSSAVRALEDAGAEVVVVADRGGRVDARAAMLYLSQLGLRSVLCEGGSEVAAALLSQNLVDRLLFFVAPKLVGGREAPGPVAGSGIAAMNDATPTGRIRVLRFPPDIALEADLLNGAAGGSTGA